jgi:hypothetical protein
MRLAKCFDRKGAAAGVIIIDHIYLPLVEGPSSAGRFILAPHRPHFSAHPLFN